MIPNKTDTTVQSNITGNKIAMRFDAAATIHLMGVMTDLYTDPETAIIREYSTNARDSHIEANQSRPIEVGLPTELRPMLTIKDYGVGLDEEAIEKVYSLYGASTKRESNEQSGVLGLGCKSALSYTPQFSVVGIKDGIRTMVSISRDEDGSGSMTIVEKKPTDEPNGVEVIIPTKRYNQLEAKAKNFFKFWKPGTVLVNGKSVDPIDGLKVSDSMWLIKTQGYNESDTVIMGDVPYEVPQEVSIFERAGYGYGERYKLVAEVGLGELDFTPSRESLQLTQRTKTRMAQLKSEYETNITKAVQKEVDKCTTNWDALAKAKEWATALHQSNVSIISGLTFKGKPIPEQVEGPKKQLTVIVRKSERTLSSCEEREAPFNIAMLVNAILVHGFDVKFTATHKKKLMEWAGKQEIPVEHFILTDSKFPHSEWVDKNSIVDWETIKEVVLEKAVTWGYGNMAKKITGSYVAWLPKGHAKAESSSSGKVQELEAEDIEAPVYYFRTNEFGGRWNDEELAKLFREYESKGTLVKLPENRVDKFLRDFPEAIKAKTQLEKLFEARVKALGDKVVKAWEIQDSSFCHSLKILDDKRIDDPKLAEAVKLSRLDIKTKISSLRELRRHRLSNYLKIPGVTSQENAYDLEKQYPLITGAGYYSKATDDHYIYVNAKHKEVV